MIDECSFKVKSILYLFNPSLSIRINSTIGIIVGSFGNNLTARRNILGEHMASQEGFSTNKPPLIGKTNYNFWSIRMLTYLMTLGFNI
jgi:hypothetical protein